MELRFISDINEANIYLSARRRAQPSTQNRNQREYDTELACSMAVLMAHHDTSSHTLGLFPDTENTLTTTELSVHSRAMFKAAILLSHQYNMTMAGQLIGWQTAQTGGSRINALSRLCQAVATSTIAGVIGPALSRETHTVAEFAERLGIPVVSYAATDPDLSDRNIYSNFYRTVPSDNATASAIVKLFAQFNWTSCVIIHQNDAYGNGGAKAIREAFVKNSLTVREVILFDIPALQIRGNLTDSLTKSTARIVLLWAQSAYAAKILQSALDSDVLGPLFTWILSSSVDLTSFDRSSHSSLVGILTVEPFQGPLLELPMNSILLNAAYQVWQQYEPETFPGSTKVNNYALFAFDATWLLIQSLRQLCPTVKNDSSACVSWIGSLHCFDRRLVPSGVLLAAIDATQFLGVSGPVQFTNNGTDRIGGSYYYAQNVQATSNGALHFSPVLEYANSGRWKALAEAPILIWPGNSLVPPADRAILRGVTLRVGVIESSPFIMITNVSDVPGQNVTKLSSYLPNLIELLRKRMGFLPIIQVASSNETYSGLVQAVANGDYDIVVTDMKITSKRNESVDFFRAIFDNSLRLIMRKSPDPSVDFLAFLKSFSRSLWVALLATGIVYSAVLSICFAANTLLGYGVYFPIRTAAGRLLCAGVTILLSTLYVSSTANLASDLTVSNSKNVISGIDDLKNGKIPFGRIGVLVTTSGEYYYLRRISGGVRNFFPLKSRQEIFDRLLAGVIDVPFLDAGFADYITTTMYCNLTLIGNSFDQGDYGFVVPKQWLYAEDLNISILFLRESSALDDLKQEWFPTNNCPDSSTEMSSAMNAGFLSGLFSMFGLIALLSLVLFAWQKRCFLYKFVSVSR